MAKYTFNVRSAFNIRCQQDERKEAPHLRVWNLCRQLCSHIFSTRSSIPPPLYLRLLMLPHIKNQFERFIGNIFGGCVDAWEENKPTGENGEKDTRQGPDIRSRRHVMNKTTFCISDHIFRAYICRAEEASVDCARQEGWRGCR